MVHNFRVFIDLSYDDENGEYPAPNTTAIEHMIYNAVKPVIINKGFVHDINVEAERQD